MNITPQELDRLRHLEGDERQNFIDDLAKPRLMRMTPAEQATQGFHWVQNDVTGDVCLLFIGAPVDHDGQQCYLVLDADKPGQTYHWPVEHVLTTDHPPVKKPEN